MIGISEPCAWTDLQLELPKVQGVPLCDTGDWDLADDAADWPSDWARKLYRQDKEPIHFQVGSNAVRVVFAPQSSPVARTIESGQVAFGVGADKSLRYIEVRNLSLESMREMKEGLYAGAASRRKKFGES